MSFDLSSLAAFAATTATRTAAPKNASTLTVEEAREVVKINIQEPKGSVDVGKQYITLKLGQVKLSLEAIAPKLDRLAVAEADIEAVSATLQAAITDGTFDAAIVEGQAKIVAGFEKLKETKAKLAAEALVPTEVATEEEAVAEIGGLDLDALEDELDV